MLARAAVKAMARALALAALLAATGAAANGDQGKALFTKDATPPCGVCHALSAAGTSGTIGPSLDELKPDAERVARVIRSGIGAMPPYPNLTDEQVKALAAYVAQASGGRK